MTQNTGEILGKETAGVNQILPHTNKWAWDLYKLGKNNNWTPEEVPMVKDVQNWKKDDVISDDERLLIKRCLGFFAGSESLVGNNLFTMFRYVTDPECRQYMSRQMYEECLHNDTIVYICDSLDLDINEVYQAYETIPSIKAKDDFLMSITSSLANNPVDSSTEQGVREIIKAAFIYWIVCEGTFFFSGFAMLLALGRQNKLPGLSDQIRYTLRDESLHIGFGTYLINTIKEQYSSVWTKKFEEETIEHVKKAVELEIQYAHDVLPRGILGLNAEMFVDYMQYIGNRRLEGIGIDYRFDSDNNPFPWLSEVVDTGAMTNFFERKVKDYQNSGVLEDDF